MSLWPRFWPTLYWTSLQSEQNVGYAAARMRHTAGDAHRPQLRSVAAACDGPGTDEHKDGHGTVLIVCATTFCFTSHTFTSAAKRVLGQLSLASLRGRLIEYQLRLG